MAEDVLGRLNRISGDALFGKTRTEPLGEDYYAIELIDEKSTRLAVPRIWIDPDADDQQIRDKITRTYLESVHPEVAPGDSSVPGL